MTRNKRLRIKLLTEYRRSDIQSSGLFDSNLVAVRLRMQQALAQPSPYLANNENLVTQLLAEHRIFAETHLKRNGLVKTAPAVAVQQRRTS